MKFEFKPELFEYRHRVMEALSDAGFWWLSHFRSVDLDHQYMLIEIDGIKSEDAALGIAKVLAARFPWGIRGLQKDYGDGDWMVILVLRGHGMKFGGRDDGGSPDGTSFEFAPADPEEPERTVEEEPAAAIEEGREKLTIGGLQMKIKPLAPEEMLRRFAKLLEAFTRRDYIPLIEITVPVRADGGTSDPGWDGMVKVILRLSDMHVSISQVRQVIPLLRTRNDLLDLLAEAILVTKRDNLNAFLAELPTAAANQYELLALVPGVFHHGLTVLQPSDSESWRLAFSVHCSVISEVLDEEMQRVAAEGETALDKK
jgi:hypothetical protein